MSSRQTGVRTITQDAAATSAKAAFKSNEYLLKRSQLTQHTDEVVVGVLLFVCMNAEATHPRRQMPKTWALWLNAFMPQ